MAARVAHWGPLRAKLIHWKLPEQSAQAVVTRLASLPEPEAAREAAWLEAACAGPNAERALATYDALNQLIREDAVAAGRLTASLREALIRGVAEARTSDDVGQEGILGQRQALEAARALVQMDGMELQRVVSAFRRAAKSPHAAPTADAHAERSLLLKAIAATSSTDAAGFHTDIPAILAFADEIRGKDRTALIRSTTLIDIEAANTSTLDPNDLTVPGTDDRGDNDGLFQRWADACGPALAQMLRGELDPIYALALNKAMQDPNPDGLIGKEQRESLERTRFYSDSDTEVQLTPAQRTEFEENGRLPQGIWAERGVAVSRRERQAEAAVWRTAKRLRLGHLERSALLQFLHAYPLSKDRRQLAANALEKVRALGGGHPTHEELGWIRDESTRQSDGMMLPATLDDISRAATHAHYVHRTVTGSLTDATLDEWDARLQTGVDVPIRVSDDSNRGGHFLLLGDVRGEKTRRRYRVSDPWTGRTVWVSRNQLMSKRPSWINEYFGLDWTRVSHFYVEK